MSKDQDNYDLHTEAGMANAVQWTSRMVDALNDGGVWAIPRSGTMVHIVSKENKEVSISAGFLPDTSIARVFEAMGWKVSRK